MYLHCRILYSTKILFVLYIRSIKIEYYICNSSETLPNSRSQGGQLASVIPAAVASMAGNSLAGTSNPGASNAGNPAGGISTARTCWLPGPVR